MTVDCASVGLDNKDDVAGLEEWYASDGNMPVIRDYATWGGRNLWEEIELTTNLFTLLYELLLCRWESRRRRLGRMNRLLWMSIIC